MISHTHLDIVKEKQEKITENRTSVGSTEVLVLTDKYEGNWEC